MAYYISRSYKLKLNPLNIFKVLSRRRGCFYLDSSLACKGRGRFSVFGIEPFFTIVATNSNPFPKIRELLKKYRLEAKGNNIPFLSGAVGYLGYELGFRLEKKLAVRPKPGIGIPDCVLGFYNTAVVIDNLKKQLHIFAVGFPETRHNQAKLLAEENFRKMYSLIEKAAETRDKDKTSGTSRGGFLKSNFKKDEYIKAIRKAKDYIRNGDIYQLNLTQRFEGSTTIGAAAIYRRLRNLSPSCFGGYFDGGDFQIISSSPERFLSLHKNKVVTSPMKGTRPRGTREKDDLLLKQQLLKSAKDKAELVMIVDLERNDLGRVCKYGSIRVKALRELERYKTVYQTTSTIEGELRENKDAVDLLEACFPGGSITGCPKIRAMEIINELEPDRRDAYTGSLGYISFHGGMDFNILIRTILKKQNRIYFGAGGGIVADSEPETEYDETLVKARAMIEASR